MKSFYELCGQFLRDEMEGYYSALELSNDLWYNAADVQLIYSTASEGGGQVLRPAFNWIFHSKFFLLSLKTRSLLLIAA